MPLPTMLVQLLNLANLQTRRAISAERSGRDGSQYRADARRARTGVSRILRNETPGQLHCAACGLTGIRMAYAEAEHLTDVHNQLHHGSRTAIVRRARRVAA